MKDEEDRNAKAYGAGLMEYDQFQEMAKDVRRERKLCESHVGEISGKNLEVPVVRNKETDKLISATITVLKEWAGVTKSSLLAI